MSKKKFFFDKHIEIRKFEIILKEENKAFKMMKRKITIILGEFMAFTSFIMNHAFSQGKPHLGALRIYPLFQERIDVDDNILQGSVKGVVHCRGAGKKSDIIKIDTPGL